MESNVDQDVTQTITEERNIAQVFQFPVIYGTMSVYENSSSKMPSISRRSN